MRVLPFVVDTVADLKENKKPFWSNSTNCNMVRFDCIEFYFAVVNHLYFLFFFVKLVET